MSIFNKNERGPFILAATREIKKLNDEKEKELGATYLWDWETAGYEIMRNMEEEANMHPGQYSQLAFFIALRLKFSNDEVRKLMYDALIFHKKYYTASINGKETIFDTMHAGGLDYYSAIFSQYLELPKSKEDKLPNHINLPDVVHYIPMKTMYARLSDDGSYIIYYSADEYHKKFGLTPLEEHNKPKTPEEQAMINAYMNIFNEEKENFVKKYKCRPFKWSQEQIDEFNKYVDTVAAEKGIKI